VHPALSVILFTVLSGAGYGLMTLAGLGGVLGIVPRDPATGGLALGAALLLTTLGLVASTLHLRHPERAWRAFSQWRSSWLSREAVAAVATFPPALWLAGVWVFRGEVSMVAALLTAAGAIATVLCTGMIYASLRPVPRWHHPLTVPVYLALAAATGGVGLVAAARLGGGAGYALELTALLALLVAWTLKGAWWRLTDRPALGPTTADATGLVGRGPVRLLDPPHTGSSYLLDEMGYRIARKHAAKLRRIALVLGMGVPVLLIVLTTGWPPAWLGGGAAVLALVAGLAGTLIERWLFFAEARHTVVLYYGAESLA
jgi:DMSO reductase anchor subunit